MIKSVLRVLDLLKMIEKNDDLGFNLPVFEMSKNKQPKRDRQYDSGKCGEPS